jgi:Flp pilus assembly protein TadD
MYLNTLGIAQYRAGKWDDAIDTLNRSAETSGTAESFDTFFLAMAYWQRGETEVARDWLKKAITWMDHNAPKDAELLEFRKEAETLIVPER